MSSNCVVIGGANASHPEVIFSPECTAHDRYLVQILAGFALPDQDMAGLGAMIGFLVAGGLTQIFSLLLHRLKDCKSHTLRRDGEITKTHFTYKTVKRLSPAAVDDPLQFWIALISAFLVALSDQQLLLGLLVLVVIVVTKGASFSMYMAQLISYFTLMTHAATFSAMRPYFRRYRWLTSIRVMVMITAYTLFIIANAGLFVTLKEIIALPLVQRKHAAVGQFQSYYREFATVFGINIGIMTWIYLSMIPSLFISDELVAVRKVIATWPLREEDLDTSIISDWLHNQKTGDRTIGFSVGTMFSRPYGLYCRLFLRTKSKPMRAVLWLVAEIFFPWALIPATLFILFCGMFAYLCSTESNYASQTVWSYGQIVTMVMVTLPVWGLIQMYCQEKLAAEQQKQEASTKNEHVNIESKAWADKLGSPGSLDTGDRDIEEEPEYRPRLRQYEDTIR